MAPNAAHLTGGREEVLWVEQRGHNAFSVLSVPVWIYGVSVGSIVGASDQRGSPLIFGRALRASPGGTVRFIVPRGVRASDVYLSRVIPDAKRLGIFIGPATFSILGSLRYTFTIGASGGRKWEVISTPW
jgi:hypothetical protein